jgi:hypothetical protein
MVRLLFILLCLAGPAAASADLCERAARQAAAEAGVPADLMLAISLAETGLTRGGRFGPWPWTANLEGTGHRFDSPAALAAFAEGAVAAGRTSLDIGCFQINWRWHGAAFRRPADLVDPLTGARHAAAFLLGLVAELGSWDAAIGAYHSRDPVRAARYAERVRTLRAGLGPPPAPEAPARSSWPLLAGGPAASAGSLVPASSGTRPFLTGVSP